MVEDRAPLQTEAAVRSQQGIAGQLRSHLAVAQDPMRQHSEHGSARGTLQTPDGETAQPDPGILGTHGQDRLCWLMLSDNLQRDGSDFSRGMYVVLLTSKRRL